MKRHYLGIRRGGSLMGVVACAYLVGCGTTTQTGIQTDITQPESPLQSSLSETTDALSGTDAADVGSTAPNKAVERDVSRIPSCVVMTSNPSPLDPNNLPLQYAINWTYTRCAWGTLGGMVSGTRSIAVTRDPNAHQTTIAGSQALVRDAINGNQLVANANSTVVSTGTRESGTVNRTVTTAGTRVDTAATGKERFNHTFNHSLTVADSYVADPNGGYMLTQRVINGSGELDHNLIQAVSKTTFDNVTYQPSACSWPVSGKLSVETTFKNGNIESDSYTWSTPCGTVTLGSGQTEVLNDAP